MKNRLSLAVVFLSLVYALLSLMPSADDDTGLTLAELTSVGQNDRRWLGDYFNFDRKPSEATISLASLEIESIFYGVLGVCGLMLALRIFISALRMLKEERALAKRKSPETSIDVAPLVQSYHDKVNAPALARSVAQSDFDEPGTDNPATFAERASAAPNRSFSLYTRGLTARMIVTFSAIVAAFGLGIVALVYFTLTSSLSKHIMERSKVTALNVSDGAPGYLLKNDAARLREVLRRQASRPELAYILVENRVGEIFAHSFAVLPDEIRDSTSSGGHRVDMYRSFRLGVAVVDEVTVPIMEGRAGKVRLGVWRDQVHAEINETVMPLVKLLLVLVAGAIVMAVFLAWRINRPIHKLVAAAKAISAGELDTPSVRIQGTTEISELARALERMRSSVKAAMIRLGR
jgi:HAMP domain-containing protein